MRGERGAREHSPAGPSGVPGPPAEAGDVRAEPSPSGGMRASPRPSPGPLVESGLVPRGQGLARAWQIHPQSSTVGFYEAHGPPFRFPRRAPRLRLSDVAFSHEVCPVSTEASLPATPLRSLLQGRLVTCPATSSGKEKKKKSPNNCSLVFKRSGGWGLWGGGEARWGLERSRVL